jgi:hypothetical protein
MHKDKVNTAKLGQIVRDILDILESKQEGAHLVLFRHFWQVACNPKPNAADQTRIKRGLWVNGSKWEKACCCQTYHNSLKTHWLCSDGKLVIDREECPTQRPLIKSNNYGSPRTTPPSPSTRARAREEAAQGPRTGTRKEIGIHINSSGLVLGGRGCDDRTCRPGVVVVVAINATLCKQHCAILRRDHHERSERRRSLQFDG